MNIMEIRKNLELLKTNFLMRKHPVSLVHFVTNRCNARCSFCFVDFDNPDTLKQELTIDEIEKLSGTLGPGIENINLTGGEPFLRKDLTEISELYVKNAKIRSLFITSNGSLPERIEKYLTYLGGKFPGLRITVSFSIDNLREKHDRIRTRDGLFDDCIESYRIVRKFGGNVSANISVTVSTENSQDIEQVYAALVDRYKIDAITACLVRDEGVYRTPAEKKQELLNAYKKLTSSISSDISNGSLQGYSRKTLQGRLMNKKNEIMYKNIISTYMRPEFISYCYAASLFGIISADGSVFPCEILENDIGSLRDYDMNFLKLWEDRPAKEMKKWIKDTRCNCCYECAWTFNIFSNSEYQKELLFAALKLVE